MGTSTPRTPAADDLPVRRIDRILAFMSLGLLVLSVICFVAIMIGTATGMAHEDFRLGAWPVVSAVVWTAPIIAFLLLFTVLIMTFVRRSRAARGR